MSESASHQIVLASRPHGRPEADNFRFEPVTMPALPPGGVLLRVLFVSLDPYMRGRMDAAESYAKPAEIGDVMPGAGVAEVIASDHPGYAQGEIVLAPTGWRTHAASNGVGLRKLDTVLAPVTTALGVLGMPGFTAWAGLTLIGKPASGETVVVAAASGPVGSLVGQLAMMAGARAVGIAGGADKCRYLTEALGFNVAVDHRACDFQARLIEACPDGIDVYFENVGGAVWQAVLPLLNRFARVPVCRLVSQYNGEVEETGMLAETMRGVLIKSLALRGFIGADFASEHYPQFLHTVSEALRDGRVRYREDITDGLENAPQAFIGMLAGRNFGKAIVRMAQ
jgi:NADPH-dependent curcumin reductase